MPSTATIHPDPLDADAPTVAAAGSAVPRDAPGRVGAAGDVADALADARAAQPAWAATPLSDRLAVIRSLRRLIAEHAPWLAQTVHAPHRRHLAESLSAEVVTLADACRHLERRAPRLLAPRRLSSRARGGRPRWLAGTRAEVRRVPLGVVLVIAPSNYPLYLPGVQTLQALAAGNAVLLKPAPPSRGLQPRIAAPAPPPALALASLLAQAGLPDGLLRVLDESVDAVQQAVALGVDKVFLTGSAATGAAVLNRLAPTLTPSVMELSGCDAALVLPDADLDRTADLLVFGLTLNAGRTCIAPRRVIVVDPPRQRRSIDLETRLARRLEHLDPVPVEPRAAAFAGQLLEQALAAGARTVHGRWSADAWQPVVLADARPDMPLLRSDVFVPLLSIVSVADIDRAVAAANDCPYALGASVFGSPAAGRRVAERLRAGCVTLNDLIVPTADPRLPFGGRGRSGFGSTRGDEGLLEMTAPRSIIARTGRWLPHLRPPGPHDAELMLGYLSLSHGRTLGARLRGLWRMIRAAGRPRGSAR